MSARSTKPSDCSRRGTSFRLNACRGYIRATINLPSPGTHIPKIEPVTERGSRRGQRPQELGIAARILVQVLHPGRTGAIGFADLCHAGALDLRRGARGLLLELLALVGLGAIAAAGDDQCAGALGIGEAEMQYGK